MISAEKTEIKYTVLTFATEKEMQKALSFAAATLPTEIEIGKPIPWKWQNRLFLLLVTGIGPVNAALHLGKLLGEALPLKGVVNMGVGGSFDLDVYPLQSTLLVTQEIWPEFGLITEDGVHSQKLGFSMGKRENEQVWDRIDFDSKNNIKTLGLGSLDDLPDVRSLTVAGVTGTKERANQLGTKYNAQLENMEGFALAWGCFIANLPFVELRTISNLVGSREKRHWDIKGGLQVLGKSCKLLLDFQEQRDSNK